MAMNTRVSLIRGKMTDTSAKWLTFPVKQYIVGPICAALTPKLKVTLPATAPSHKPAKKATTHGLSLNTARIRKNKRRDVDKRAAQERTFKVLTSPIHVGRGVAEELPTHAQGPDRHVPRNQHLEGQLGWNETQWIEWVEDW